MDVDAGVPASGGWPRTVAEHISSLGHRNAAPVVDDLSSDVVTATGLAGYVAAICGVLRSSGVPPGALIAVRVGLDAPSVVALLAAVAYGVAVPVAADAPDLPVGPFEVRALLTAVPPAGGETVPTIDVSDLSAIKPGDVTMVPARSAADLALLLRTSGTTGDPKWVRISHQNLIAGGTFVARTLGLSPDDRGLAVMPIHHSHGISVVLASLLSGGELVIIDPSDLTFLQESLHCGITWYSAAPTVHHSLLVAKRSWPAWFKEFQPRVIRSTSEALSATDRARLEAEFSAPVIESYALTEAPGVVCSQVFGIEAQPGWMPPQAGVEVDTIGPDHRPTEPGVPGRIRVRGRNVMLGYLTHEPLTPGGWYVTSDFGVRRPDGSLSVLGRDSDAIKRGGETIPPAVVESLVEQHPDIDRARVCGIPDERLGQRICVAVVTSRDESAADELLRELRGILPTNLMPSKLRIVASFPGTGIKFKRSDLRQLFTE